ncbi:MAG: hypothetical protein ABFC38_06740 [Methanospirillum sp.]
MQKEQDPQTGPADDRRSRGPTEPDPNREQRTGGESRTIGKSIQQEDRK